MRLYLENIYPPNHAARSSPDWIIILEESRLLGFWSVTHAWFRHRGLNGRMYWLDEAGRRPSSAVWEYLQSIVLEHVTVKGHVPGIKPSWSKP